MLSKMKSKTTTKNQDRPLAPSEWLGTSLTVMRGIESAAELVPFPYVKGVAGVVVTLLEVIQVRDRSLSALKSGEG